MATGSLRIRWMLRNMLGAFALGAVLVMAISCDNDKDMTTTPEPQPAATEWVKVLYPNGSEVVSPHSGPHVPATILRWDSSAGIVGYKVYYSTCFGGYWRDVSWAIIPYKHWTWIFPGWEYLACEEFVSLIKVVGYDKDGNAVAEDTSDAPFAFTCQINPD